MQILNHWATQEIPIRIFDVLTEVSGATLTTKEKQWMQTVIHGKWKEAYHLYLTGKEEWGI